MQAKQGHSTLTYDIIGKKQMLQMLQVRQVVQESDSVAAEAQPPQQRHRFQPLYSADYVVTKHLQTPVTAGWFRHGCAIKWKDMRAATSSVQLLQPSSCSIVAMFMLHLTGGSEAGAVIIIITNAS